jgi:hypothetical protein
MSLYATLLLRKRQPSPLQWVPQRDLRAINVFLKQGALTRKQRKKRLTGLLSR